MPSNRFLVVLLVTFCEIAAHSHLPFSIRFGKFPRLHAQNDLRDSKYKYEVKTFEVPVDHFSFSIKDTFEMRYLVNDTWQAKKNAPIFFYTGNEGDIETFAENTGFMWEIAPSFNALVIFAEHRYYGKSLPYGNKSYSDSQHLGYLTSQQALADYVELISHLRSKPETKRSPVIVFGGSYGGMLSAWMRMKYPHIVQGAIAASAPILQFPGVTPCEAYMRIITSDFRAAYTECPKLIRKSWNVINNITSDDDGKKWLSDNWKLCTPLNNQSNVEQLKSWLEDVYAYLSMSDYPYPANFLTPLPGNPVHAFCQHLRNASLTGKPLLMALQGAINMYTNYTGRATCVSTSDAAPELNASGWPYQACTEMVMPMCSDGVNDMFEPKPWNLEEYSDDCNKLFGINPRPHLVCEQYGCLDISTATNIVFSNGLLDPWSSGGVLRNLSPSAIAVIIPEGAHHLDLRGSNANDPFSVIKVRDIHRSSIKRWITEYQQTIVRTPSLL